jgi:hypothetical protein
LWSAGTCRVLIAVLSAARKLAAMSRPPERSTADSLVYRGEVWTDGRGYATVILPAGSESPPPPLEYALRAINGQITVRVHSELRDGRFTIASDQPRVKVAWRVEGRSASPNEPTPPPTGEEVHR